MVNSAVLLMNNQATWQEVQALMGPENLNAFTGFLISLVVIVGIVVLISVVLKSSKKRKSLEYRELMADMYVVGTIKNFAKEDKVDLEKELSIFNKMMSKARKQAKKDEFGSDVDSVVSDNLQEKIEAITEKKVAEIESSKSKEEILNDFK